MSPKIVTLWVPNLINSARLNAINAENLTLSKTDTPALNQLLSKADKHPYAPQNVYQTACHLCHQPSMLSIAPTLAALSCPNFNPQDFWVKVDPVQMLPDRDTLVLFPPKTLNIQWAEATALIQAFNLHFEQDKVQIELGEVSPNDWFIRIKQPVDIQSTLLDQVAFQSVANKMPQGNAATYWKQLMNETQMLFYTHPVNEARREQGLPEINSIWVWGEGQLTEAQQNITGFEDWQIYTHFNYLQGLSHLMHSKCQKPPKNAQAWLNLAEKTRHLIHLDLNPEGSEMTFEHWKKGVQQLEQNWFVPLLEEVKQGGIQSLLLDFGEGKRFHVTPQTLKKFWRFNRLFSKYFN